MSTSEDSDTIQCGKNTNQRGLTLKYEKQIDLQVKKLSEEMAERCPKLEILLSLFQETQKLKKNQGKIILFTACYKRVRYNNMSLSITVRNTAYMRKLHLKFVVIVYLFEYCIFMRCSRAIFHNGQNTNFN